MEGRAGKEIMLVYMKFLHEENMLLRVQLLDEREGKYETPATRTPEELS